MKCIVHGCENHHGEGRFVGDMCAPCHQMITTGVVGSGMTFVNRLVSERVANAKSAAHNWEVRARMYERHRAKEICDLRGALAVISKLPQKPFPDPDRNIKTWGLAAHAAYCEATRVADAALLRDYGRSDDDDPLRAHLVTAAPDLLAVCQEFVRKVDAGEARSTKSYEQMKEAIAKATGAVVEKTMDWSAGFMPRAEVSTDHRSVPRREPDQDAHYKVAGVFRDNFDHREVTCPFCGDHDAVPPQACYYMSAAVKCIHYAAIRKAEDLRRSLADPAAEIAAPPPSGTSALITERQNTHGVFRENTMFMQEVKDIMRSQPKWSKMEPYQREGLDMIIHKIGRALHGDPNFKDTWDDISGYAQRVAGYLR